MVKIVRQWMQSAIVQYVKVKKKNSVPDGGYHVTYSSFSDDAKSIPVKTATSDTAAATTDDSDKNMAALLSTALHTPTALHGLRRFCNLINIPVAEATDAP
ncbi:hypothetical protein CBL_07365 [Carabus blaptoides fortunei]